MKQIKPVQFEIYSSKNLKYFIIITHLFAIMACLANALPGWIKLMLVLAVSFHGFLMWRMYFQKPSNIKLSYRQKAGWQLETKDEIHAIQILASTVLSDYAIILHFAPAFGKKQSILIVKDAMLSDAFRELTVALKIYGMM
jgi:hypothetical protein